MAIQDPVNGYDESDPGFGILYEEGPCLAVAKPGGLLTQAPPGIDSLETRVKQYFKQRDNKPGRVYLGVPHRLDRPVSGVLVLARHVRAARRLSEQFAGRLVRKIYWALLEGRLEPDQGEWVDYVRKIPDVAQAEIVARNHADARIAVLRYVVLRHAGDVTWAAIELETGRTHQIRVQAAGHGHPVVGDIQYGATLPFGPACEDPRDRCIALHARSLAFQHPMTRTTQAVTAPLPKIWQSHGIGTP